MDGCVAAHSSNAADVVYPHAARVARVVNPMLVSLLLT
jgi:hypothetical protein